MSSILQARQEQPRPDGWFGRVASAPASLSDTLLVIIPAFDDQQTFGPCRWQSRDDVSLPAPGDECFVIFDDRRQPWVIAWWPY